MHTSHVPKGNCGCVSGQSGVSLLLSLLTTNSSSLESPVLGGEQEEPFGACRR